MGEVTNEDSVWALVEFANGAYGTLEGCRVINGASSSLSFDLNGTRGAASWDFLRMNELDLYLPDESGFHDGHTRIRSGPEHPFHTDFYPGNGQGLGFEDLKAIEVFQFLSSVAEGRQGEPGFAEALAVAGVQDAIMRSWESDSWEDVSSLRLT
jgi:predicted dehydrogenase